MKKQVFLRWLWCVLEYLFFFPAGILVAGLFLPYRTGVILLPTLPVHLLFGLVLTAVLKRFKKFAVVLAGIVYTAIAAAVYNAVVPLASVTDAAIVIAATAFFYAWGIRAGTGEATTRLFLFSGGLVIHIVSLFLINNIVTLNPYFKLAVWVSIVYCLAGLPLANRRFLINETYEKSSLKRIPGSVNRGNIIAVSVIISGIVLLSFWHLLLDAFIYLTQSLKEFFLKIIEFLGSLYEPSEIIGDNTPQAPDTFPPAEEQASILSVILNTVSVLVFAAVLFLVIRYIVRNWKKIYYALYSLLSSLFSRFQKWSTTEQGYFDREESLLKTEIQKKPVFRRLFRRWPKWRDMKDNESRVRFIYTKFVTDYIKKGFRLSLSDTPSEVVERIQKFDGETSDHAMLNEVYNSVRYGAKKADDDTVRILKDRYL